MYKHQISSSQLYDYPLAGGLNSAAFVSNLSQAIIPSIVNITVTLAFIHPNHKAMSSIHSYSRFYPSKSQGNVHHPQLFSLLSIQITRQCPPSTVILAFINPNHKAMSSIHSYSCFYQSKTQGNVLHLQVMTSACI